jgi:hydrogenase maturation protease
MNSKPRRTLILALDHDILGDEGVSLAAARLLEEEFAGEVELVEAGSASFALLELLEGYDRALLLDAIFTGQHPPGTVLEFSRENISMQAAPAVHYLGLPEVLRLAEQLGIDFPKDIRILALEVRNPLQFRQGLTPEVPQALAVFLDRARQVLRDWREADVA